MTNAKVLTSVGAVVMGSALAFGFAAGDFWGDGRVARGHGPDGSRLSS